MLKTDTCNSYFNFFINLTFVLLCTLSNIFQEMRKFFKMGNRNDYAARAASIPKAAAPAKCLKILRNSNCFRRRSALKGTVIKNPDCRLGSERTPLPSQKCHVEKNTNLRLAHREKSTFIAMDERIRSESRSDSNSLIINKLPFFSKKNMQRESNVQNEDNVSELTIVSQYCYESYDELSIEGGAYILHFEDEETILDGEVFHNRDLFNHKRNINFLPNFPLTPTLSPR